MVKGQAQICLEQVKGRVPVTCMDGREYLADKNCAYDLIILNDVLEHVPASEALYRTHRHGAVTIDRAMELDAIHDAYQAQQARLSKPGPQFDAYSAAEDRFIDLHGMSSSLD